MKKVLLAALAILVCSLSAFGQDTGKSGYFFKKQAFEIDSLYCTLTVLGWPKPDFTPELYNHLCKIMFGEQGASLEEGYKAFVENTGKPYATNTFKPKKIPFFTTRSCIELLTKEYKPGKFVTGKVTIFNNLLAILPNKLKGNAEKQVDYFFMYDLEHDRLVTPENVFTDPSIVKDRENLETLWAENGVLYMRYKSDPANANTYSINAISEYLTQDFKDIYPTAFRQPDQATGSNAKVAQGSDRKTVTSNANGKQEEGEVIKARAVTAQQDRSGAQVYDVVEQMPKFPGGDAALFQFLSTNIKYPPIAEENGVQGSVIVTFVVERDGSISDIRLAQPKHPLLNAEAVRVISKMPRWTPGKQNGKAVRVKYTVPVMFRLL